MLMWNNRHTKYAEKRKFFCGGAGGGVGVVGPWFTQVGAFGTVNLIFLGSVLYFWFTQVGAF